MMEKRVVGRRGLRITNSVLSRCLPVWWGNDFLAAFLLTLPGVPGDSPYVEIKTSSVFFASFSDLIYDWIVAHVYSPISSSGR